MAVGSPPPVDIAPVAGFRLAALAAGIKKNQTPDMILVAMDRPCATAGVFTRNQVVAAPVLVCRNRLPGGKARALLVNAGNANAGTGPQGMLDALGLCREVADALGVPDEQVFPASTGVIGQSLPLARMRSAIPGLVAGLRPDGWEAAARAILTTDTFPKARQRLCRVDGQTVRMAGFAKGAGMIHPDMATMLAYLFTDAAIEPRPWQVLLERAVAQSFHCITVDGDTSTNDTVMAFASGLAGNAPITDADDPRAAPLAEAIDSLTRELAHLVVRDGEGATKFITIQVTGAVSPDAARTVAMTVAQSSLFKTACFGNDPNWGRILAAVGRAGVPLKTDAIRIDLGEVTIVRGGGPDPNYTEEQGQAVMNREEIPIRIDLGAGDAQATVWTCDLSHDYVSINADYRS
ncbi:MAG: bifunctional glutamate N-acetyltransferase/amino-acid acetyltransferase ArgJ [Magnetococcales bacterium]|nr:bifunctional glutamate N-acetyltransferase/amino-acid acetyltransferase ArgJ [Magnetococcales bacterium]